MKNIFILVGLLGLSLDLLGQSDRECLQKLEEAEELYKQGKIEEVEEKLKEATCIDNDEKLDTKDKVVAYKLLTNTYLYYNEKDKAVESMRQFLTYNPEYELDTTENGDSPEFKSLYHEFRTHPIYFYGITIGGNYTLPYATKRYSLDNSSDTDINYLGKQSLHAGFAVDFYLGKNWFLNPSLIYAQKAYGYDAKNLLGFANISYTERQSYINIPLVLRKYFNIKKKIDKDGQEVKVNRKFHPYIQAGASMDILLSAKSEIIREDILGSEGGSSRRIEGADINMINQRKTLNYNLTMGGGFMLDHFIGKSNLLVDLRYHFNLNNRVKTDERLATPEYAFDYLHVDDDYKLGYAELSISLLIPKFSPLHYPSREEKKQQKKNKKSKENASDTGVKETIENNSK